MYKYLSYYLLLSVLAIPVFAETVILKNRQIIKGKVTGQNQHTLEINVDGKVQTIPKNKILKVVYKDVNQDEAEKIRKQEEDKLKKEEAEKKRLAAEEEKKKAEDEAKLAEEKVRVDHDRPQQSVGNGLKPFPTKTPVLWRSAVLPGWGQIHADRTKTGIGWATLFVASLANVNSQYRHFKETKEIYNEVFSPGNIYGISIAGNIYSSIPNLSQLMFIYNRTTFYGEYQKAGKNLNTAIGITALVYALQLGHAWWVGGKDLEKSNSSVMRNIDFNITTERAPGFTANSRQYGKAYENKTYLQYNWYF